MGRDLNLIKMGTELIQCSICLEFPIEPLECKGCDNLFCKECLLLWFRVTEKLECPHRCEKLYFSTVDHTLARLTRCVTTKCRNENCSYQGSIDEVTKHEELCIPLNENRADIAYEKIVELINSRRDAEWMMYLLSAYRPPPPYYLCY
ncbi:unnamed protein product [Blepharisma stoltei]|uniref:RING-type domain-containing protein n=1 Tax=Blepharisma stoltei TaxID=1481888 RepID=A0AAU9JDX1_9CILI|nr:unnamed protein product [Blepharisma stoltei]